MKKLIALLLAVVFMAGSVFSVSAAEEEQTLAETYKQAAWDEGNVVLGQEIADLNALMAGIIDGDGYLNNLDYAYGFYNQTIVDMWDYSMYLRSLALTGAQTIFAMDSESYSQRSTMFNDLNNVLVNEIISEVYDYYKEQILDAAVDYFQYGLLSDATDEMEYSVGYMYRINDQSITRTTRIRVEMELNSASWDISHFLQNMARCFDQEEYFLAQIYLAEFENQINELNGTTEEGAPLSYYSLSRNDLNDTLAVINAEFSAILGDVYDAETYMANQDRIHVFMQWTASEIRAFCMRNLVSGLDLVTEAINGGMTGSELSMYIEDIRHIQEMSVKEVYSLVYEELSQNITDYCCDAMVEYCEYADNYWTLRDEEYDFGYDFRDWIYNIYNEFDDNVDDSLDAIDYAARYNKLSRALALTNLYRDEFAAEL